MFPYLYEGYNNMNAITSSSNVIYVWPKHLFHRLHNTIDCQVCWTRYDNA